MDPATVQAPGEVEFTITGSGWGGVDDGIVFIYSCVVPESGDAADISLPCEPVEDLVDNGANVDEDGSFENALAFMVPADGLCVAVADLGGQQVAATCISVGTNTALANTGAASDWLAILGLALVVVGALFVGAARPRSVT